MDKIPAVQFRLNIPAVAQTQTQTTVCTQIATTQTASHRKQVKQGSNKVSPQRYYEQTHIPRIGIIHAADIGTNPGQIFKRGS
jgi:hypothetical protein